MAELKKLRECPFCGGEAKIDWYEDDSNKTHWFIYCCDCSCELSFNTETSKEEAIETWNSRATEAEIRAKAIDEFAEKAIKIVYEANNRRRNPQPRDMVADIHYKLRDLAEQLKEVKE